jgi:hypothetical protein
MRRLRIIKRLDNAAILSSHGREPRARSANGLATARQADSRAPFAFVGRSACLDVIARVGRPCSRSRTCSRRECPAQHSASRDGRYRYRPIGAVRVRWRDARGHAEDRYYRTTRD